jgi:hypothetical protein
LTPQKVRGLGEGVSKLTLTIKADIIKHVIEVLQEEMGLMKVEFNEVMLECDVLCEQLGAC